MLREFLFNTGVLPNSGSKLFGEFQEWRNGVKVIRFYADVSEDVFFMFACDNDSLPESKIPGVIVVPITGGLCSKFGYFRTPS